MAFPKNKVLTFVYEYDFDLDGGSVGTLDLRCLSANEMDESLVILNLSASIETAFDDTSDTATVTLGNEDDTDGYFADFMTIAETANSLVGVGTVAGDLLWDDTNDHQIQYRIPDAGAAQPQLTITTEALTQGKAKFIFKCLRY